ncbi:RelE family toxin-antitoxin system [Klebsiella pneumoniae]|nr:RelE family toxin-antitoxin system [Klebsiella pneumoniae]
MTTDITKLAQSLKAAATDVKETAHIARYVKATIARQTFKELMTPENILALVEALESEKRICATWRKTAEANSEKLEKAQAKADVYDMLRDDYGLREKGVGLADFVDWQANRIAELESRTVKPAPVIPSELHPDTQKLVTDFCTALAEKLYKAQLKYGYDADWKQDGWPSQCQTHFHQHIAKGDPRDVAAYCAFMWWHGWSTKPAECLEPRTVTVKLPDYRNTYKSPLADEVEHQVRLALELLSSAAGIKVEAE